VTEEVPGRLRINEEGARGRRGERINR